METAARPVNSPLRLYYRRSSSSAAATTSSPLPLFMHKGPYLGSSPNKLAFSRNSYGTALNSSSSIQRKHVRGPWHCYLQEGFNFNHPRFHYTLHKKRQLARDNVVRSELVGTGVPDAAYPVSEVKLGSKIRGICFYAVTAIVAIFLIVIMLVQHPFVLLLDRYRRKAHHFIAKTWATLTIAPFVTIEYEGLENLPSSDTPAVYVSNHQSFLDIYTLLTLSRGFKFISKTSIFVFPIIGWAMFMMGVIPLKRMDSRSQLECLKRCMDLVKNGGSVFFFPEGTRSKDGKLGTFKKGAFSVAAKTKVPIVPMTLMGTGNIMPAGMEGIVNSGTIKVVIHKPIEGNDPEALCKEARNKIAETLSQQG